MILTLAALIAATVLGWGAAIWHISRPWPHPRKARYRDPYGREYGKLDEKELERLIRGG